MHDSNRGLTPVIWFELAASAITLLVPCRASETMLRGQSQAGWATEQVNPASVFGLIGTHCAARKSGASLLFGLTTTNSIPASLARRTHHTSSMFGTSNERWFNPVLGWVKTEKT